MMVCPQLCQERGVPARAATGKAPSEEYAQEWGVVSGPGSAFFKRVAPEDCA